MNRPLLRLAPRSAARPGATGQDSLQIFYDPIDQIAQLRTAVLARRFRRPAARSGQPHRLGRTANTAAPTANTASHDGRPATAQPLPAQEN
jgi:hypothetical protein